MAVGLASGQGFPTIIIVQGRGEVKGKKRFFFGLKVARRLKGDEKCHLGDGFNEGFRRKVSEER